MTALAHCPICNRQGVIRVAIVPGGVQFISGQRCDNCGAPLTSSSVGANLAGRSGSGSVVLGRMATPGNQVRRATAFGITAFLQEAS